MSRDIDHIIKDVLKKQDDLFKNENLISKDIISLKKDIDNIKKETKAISNKIDLILEILNNFTIMLFDEEQDEYREDDIYDSDTTWLPNQDEWNDHEDDS
jgi:hypothetical protein